MSYAYFCTHSGGTTSVVLKTLDGKTFTDELVLTGLVHNDDMAITPTVLNRNGTVWMITNISNVFGPGGQQLHLDLWTVNPATLACTFVTEIDFSSVIGTGASAAVWSAQWFVDVDGSVHLFAGASPDQSIGIGFLIYEVHPTDTSGFTTWSTPVFFGVDTHLPYIDPYMMRVGSTYYLWVKDNVDWVELLSSSSLLSGWTRLRGGNWNGWGDHLEAPFVYQFGDQWRILLDNLGAGIYWSETPVATGFTGTWTTKQLISAPFTPQHGMFIPDPGFYPVPQRRMSLGIGLGLTTR